MILDVKKPSFLKKIKVAFSSTMKLRRQLIRKNILGMNIIKMLTNEQIRAIAEQEL